jgi:hypothetical protein
MRVAIGFLLSVLLYVSFAGTKNFAKTYTADTRDTLETVITPSESDNTVYIVASTTGGTVSGTITLLGRIQGESGGYIPMAHQVITDSDDFIQFPVRVYGDTVNVPVESFKIDRNVDVTSSTITLDINVIAR